ncbi:hypothetical protein C1I95_34225 [Micromonospora craterilacus]|uniref:Uncharacterized protein n=1 Tax=Micromonospora craterilacus TaxID=1655439 RepID=A0A2W2CXX4_9ACTN|nr:hypothetical protein [Micromonospora craterilacus]PZG02731.1 hypothetical protein C1I95_34225 [Micromonospora craterilacus]
MVTTVPTDRADYSRWLAGRYAALAGRIRSVDEPVGTLEADLLRDAATAMLAALDDADRQGGIRD